MISTYNAAGVKVIVNTLLNHMTSTESGQGVAGSSLTHYKYPGSSIRVRTFTIATWTLATTS
ncbi:hypothetical protein C8J56DRAFT_1055167 [Mycena floridula]|nr:hypothetical protein C8J56DRAFT_1055167 [Mycena floridula]